MHILMIISRYGGYGGHQAVVSNLCTQLIKKGHEITIGAFSFNRDLPEHVNKLSLRRLKLLDGCGFKFDIVHSHQTQMNYYAMNLKIPLIFHYHGTSSMLQELNLKICCLVCRKKLSKIIAGSNSALRHLRAICGNSANSVPCEVILYGVDNTLFNPNLKGPYTKGKPQLLFVGSLHKHKNIHKIIESIPDLVKSYPNVHLQIVGGGKNIERIKKDIRNLGLDAHIEILGVVFDPRELRSRYASCDIYISASKMESYGLPALEAMACGKPVLLSDIDVHKEIIQMSNAGCNFSLTDDHAVLNGINQILMNRSSYESAAKRFAELNDWSAAAERISKVYEYTASHR